MSSRSNLVSLLTMNIIGSKGEEHVRGPPKKPLQPPPTQPPLKKSLPTPPPPPQRIDAPPSLPQKKLPDVPIDHHRGSMVKRTTTTITTNQTALPRNDRALSGASDQFKTPQCKRIQPPAATKDPPKLLTLSKEQRPAVGSPPKQKPLTYEQLLLERRNSSSGDEHVSASTASTTSTPSSTRSLAITQSPVSKVESASPVVIELPAKSVAERCKKIEEDSLLDENVDRTPPKKKSARRAAERKARQSRAYSDDDLSSGSSSPERSTGSPLSSPGSPIDLSPKYSAKDLLCDIPPMFFPLTASYAFLYKKNLIYGAPPADRRAFPLEIRRRAEKLEKVAIMKEIQNQESTHFYLNQDFFDFYYNFYYG